MKSRPQTILVIEDDANDRLLLERALTKVGARQVVRCVEDGEQAIEYMLGEGQCADRKKFAYPTFIITDLNMPRKNGLDVLEFLQGNPEWAW